MWIEFMWLSTVPSGGFFRRRQPLGTVKGGGFIEQLRNC